MGYTKYRAALRALCLDELSRRVSYRADSDVRVCDDSSDCRNGKGSCDWGNEAAACGGQGCASDEDCARCRAR